MAIIPCESIPRHLTFNHNFAPITVLFKSSTFDLTPAIAFRALGAILFHFPRFAMREYPISISILSFKQNEHVCNLQVS